MKSHYLFSAKFRSVGFVLLIIGTFFGILYLSIDDLFPFMKFRVPCIYSDVGSNSLRYFKMNENNITDEIIGILIIVGGVFLGFSKEKIEDEYFTRLRLDALIWAVYLNYGILIFMIVFVYDLGFLNIMVYNLFTIIYFFNIRYFYLKKKASKLLQDEK